MKKKILATACLLALGSTAFAAEKVEDRHGFYGYLGLYQVELDAARQADKNEAWGVGAGYFFNKSWSLEIPYTNGNFETDINGNTIGKHEIENVGLDLLFNDTTWLGSANTHPFIKAGIGKHNADGNPWGSQVEEDEYYKVGIGLQHFMSDSAFVRIGADFLDGSDDYQDDKMFYINLGAFFGETVKSGAAPAPKPVEKAKDSDGDGVLDANDQCPGTPAGAAVDANGCPLDSDNDGVYDYQDACPGTAPGVQVDEKGCEVKVAEEVVVDMRLNFDTNKYEVKPEMVSEIAKVAEFLRQYPSVNAEIQGHTDSVGSSAYNQGLSERRANSVKDYLVSNFGINASRLTAKGYGEEEPIADNSTSEGRALNRRAEAHAETMTTK